MVSVTQASESRSAAPAVNWRQRPRPSFIPEGMPDLLKRLARGGFEDALSDLFRKANLTGTYKYRAQETTKGNIHTQGLNLKSYEHFGVVVTYHTGSNDNNIRVLLYPRGGMRPDVFFNLLKDAEKVEEASGSATEKKNGAHAGRILEAAPALPSEKLTEDPEPLPEPDLATRADGYRDKLAPEAVELVMEHVAKRLADKHGFLLKKDFSETVRAYFTYVPDTLRRMYRYMYLDGDLVQVENDKTRVRMGLKWRRRFLGSKESEADEASLIVETVAPADTKPSAIAARVSNGHATVEERFESLQVLANGGAYQVKEETKSVPPIQPTLQPEPNALRVAELEVLLKRKIWHLRTRQKEIRRIERLNAHEADIQEWKADATENVKRLDRELSSPKYQNLENEYAELTKLSPGTLNPQALSNELKKLSGK